MSVNFFFLLSVANVSNNQTNPSEETSSSIAIGLSVHCFASLQSFLVLLLSMTFSFHSRMKQYLRGNVWHLILAVEIVDGEFTFTIDEMVTQATARVDLQLLTVQATARVDVHGTCESAGVNLPWSEMLPRREIVFQPLHPDLDRRCQSCDSCSVSQSSLCLMNLRAQAMESGTCCSRVFVASVDCGSVCVSCHGSGILRIV